MVVVGGGGNVLCLPLHSPEEAKRGWEGGRG